MITATRFHDFSCGHRVVGHEGKCRYLHGHNYRVHFTVAPVHGLDHVGRVLDFSAINSRLCQWLEREWDHKMLLWEKDPLWAFFDQEGIHTIESYEVTIGGPGVVKVPFNPTAEEIARYLLYVIGPEQLAGTNVRLIEVTVEETRKCSAHADFRRVDTIVERGGDNAPAHID